ncbi:MAG TPA: Zn-ribbon domain-containing OB-fold protein [Candidatus Binataceae bacterium]
MSEYFKPLPKPSPTSRPFWDAAKRHELKLQRCGSCSAYIYYPRDRCPNCMSDKLSWEKVSGRGKVYSYTVVRRASSRAFADAPYVLAIVELNEGVRMTANIAAAPEQVRVDMPVEVFFDDVTPEQTLVKFKPV